MEAEEQQKKRGRPGNTYQVTWTQGGRKGAVPDYKYMCNKLENEFLTGQVCGVLAIL